MIRAVGIRDLPSGTVTFLFTDVEGSTKLLHALGADRYAEALATHRTRLRAAFTAHGGVEVDTQGDAFFVAFPTAPRALAAARAATEALGNGPIRVRIGLHTGSPLLTDEGYVGADVHKGARIAAAGHGGQILVSAATAALVDGAELKDLGLHRLKDLTEPERIYQADPDEHPPLKTLHQTNLPVPATPFLGRSAELADLAALLSRDDVRLVTLTGPGGTGKTRLALQAAADAADSFPDGVWWVPLAPLRDPALVLESAAKALGASSDLGEHIGDKRLLLLLDNFEHLMGAVDHLAPLLTACPSLTLLVTTREPLHLAGEQEFGVDPLEATDAVELFLIRALAARRDFTANGEVAQICARLDGLPLAIELAAARVKVLSPQALLERLDQRLPLLAGGSRDAPERQRTLRATIEWSHELLSADEQRLFARLAVFRGGWTLEAAEAVADADLDTLQSLVDKSLVRVRPESGRFWMLETIREYAVERLEASSEADELRERHTAHFIGWVEQAEALIGPDHRDADIWIPRLTADHDNLRSVLDRTVEGGDGERAQQLAGALWKFWYMTGAIGEGNRRVRAALAYETPPTATRVRALNGGTAMALESGDQETGRGWAQEALEIAESLGDPLEIAHAQFLLANVESSYERWDVARPLLERAREQFRALRPLGHYALLSTRVLSWVCMEMGDRDTARTLAEHNLVDARAAGNARVEAMTLGQLGFRAVDDGRLADAAPLIRESYRMKRSQGDLLGVASDLFSFARLLFAAGRSADAAEVLARSLSTYSESGAAIPTYDQAAVAALAADIRAALGADAYARAEERGPNLSEDRIDALMDELPASLH
jgi:predicted ATPase/class 3 adenylate cyclase